jgi:hypothetical protein
VLRCQVLTVSYFAPFMARLPVLGLVVCAACANPEQPSAPAADLHTPAAAAFADLARNRFAVVAFVPTAAHDRAFTDDNEWTLLLRAVPFTARVRLERDLAVATAEQLAVQAGAVLQTPDDVTLAEALIDTLGPGTWHAGREVDVRATAVFEDVGGQWRFRAFKRGIE